MAIGNGIAIAGVWVFAGLCAVSTTTTEKGMFFAVLIAAVLTILFAFVGKK